MPWYRVWTDILDSEKFAELDDATIGGWTLLLAAVKRFNQNGLLPPDKKLCHWTRRNKGTVAGWIESLLDAGLLGPTADGVRVHDWDRWQEPKDRTNAQRQAKFKAAHKAPPAPPKTESETDNRERAEQTVTAAPLPGAGNGSVTPLLALSGRSAEDQSQFDEAIELLRGSMQTEGVAMELSRGWDLSEIRSIEGWRWLNAARVMGSGAKHRTLKYLMGIARNSTREEFEAYGRPTKNGKRTDSPPTNQTINSKTRPEGLEDYDRAAAANPEHQKTLELVRSRRNGPPVPPL